MSIYSYLWSSYSISLQKQPLSNILPNPSTTPPTPCHPPCAPHATHLRPSLRSPHDPCPKYGDRDPQPPGLTPLDSNGKEAFSRRNELPMGGFRTMKMPQENNGENNDLKCDLVLCRNMDSEKGGHHKIGSL